ncbi:uncharacterized protein BXZ73DRAFT_92881 [Epithele typhae]|uniref:uncharacterized protein n=1 Tax=Epithele typhae TaxID=378194 RepID=UPI0020078EEC|nr:uncharacterized protein BXZ73DRAFT_92881 [Epithele typhae]KAH9913970.1 hypothetical protein BXZ73DRAFT_92881 [Epithele typhae]
MSDSFCHRGMTSPWREVDRRKTPGPPLDSNHDEQQRPHSKTHPLTTPQLLPMFSAWPLIDPITLVELRMRQYSGAIRAKPRWWEKINDPAIAAKYREEIVADDLAKVEHFWGGERRRQQYLWPCDSLSEEQLAYIFDELKYEAAVRDPNTGMFASGASCVPKVYESQSHIDPILKEQLVHAVSVLEDVPDDEKDWHPNTDRQVLDLVHPSLYCLCIGRSLFRPPSQDGKDDSLGILSQQDYVTKRWDIGSFESEASPAYQWLPTDFKVTETGAVSALGYINNLHPIRHRPLYNALERILARFVPLFDRVLEDTVSSDRPLPFSALNLENFVHLWYRDVPEPPQPDPSEIKDVDALYEAESEWERLHMWPTVPEPPPFAPPPHDDRVSFTLRGRTVQVIVKLANIHLTPERPTYPGGSWHVEGMLNERIVATGLYYHSVENITESRLAFRQHIGGDGDRGMIPHQQWDNRGFLAVFGFGRDSALNQRIGSVVAAEDKCVVFPNVYQHRVEAFELADRTRPGHRKIVALFLVDPIDAIHSTSDVPPQQAEWALDALEDASLTQRLPRELIDTLGEHVKGSSGLMSREEAEEHRLKLMHERSVLAEGHNQETFEALFNMCEH